MGTHCLLPPPQVHHAFGFSFTFDQHTFRHLLWLLVLFFFLLKKFMTVLDMCINFTIPPHFTSSGSFLLSPPLLSPSFPHPPLAYLIPTPSHNETLLLNSSFFHFFYVCDPLSLNSITQLCMGGFLQFWYKVVTGSLRSRDWLLVIFRAVALVFASCEVWTYTRLHCSHTSVLSGFIHSLASAQSCSASWLSCLASRGGSEPHPSI